MMFPYLDDLRRVERAGLSAWPALETGYADGWLWRASGGGFGRTNSVFTLDYEGLDADATIAEVEQWYRWRGRRARIRVSDVSEPVGLANLLKLRGYTPESPSLIMAKPVAKRLADLSGVEWSQYPSPNWLKVYFGVLDEPRRRTLPDILAMLPAPHIYVTVRRRGITFSCGLGVLEDGIVTLECIASREETRRRGGARAVLAGIEDWALKEGAHTLHLQVAANNDAAIALYRSFGFEIVGRYAYWVADAMDTAPYDGGEAENFAAGRVLPGVSLPAVRGGLIDPCSGAGTTLVAIYPWTGRPGLPNPAEWDEILGAHGSTPELEGFRDRAAGFERLGARVLAVSDQSTEHQAEMVKRLGLPFDVLSDVDGLLNQAWRLPVFEAGAKTFLRRMTLVLKAGEIVKTFYPVHPPARHAAEVVASLES